ncbi:PH domain-containing protein [Demetria terragena]|uniref:PH domain-containing protein n=1 Tax=Demetria terragena TaxID=63959 RepID=UPI00036CE741|nr:PH domain-containing protein [Demetria terragena]
MELREPANFAAPAAKAYWRWSAAAWWGGLAIAQVVTMVIWQDIAWWRWVLAALTVVILIIDAVISPPIRYRVHRWEVTPTAVYTQSGWLSIERRVAPISRVQTVDTTRGAIMRMLGLSTVTVTTASAAGEMTIELLDSRVAADLVEHLTAVAESSEDDAT